VRPSSDEALTNIYKRSFSAGTYKELKKIIIKLFEHGFLE
jgi:hypothetical protein